MSGSGDKTATDPVAQTKALFDHALNLDASARALWLAQLRTSQPDAARGVEQLLALDAQSADPFVSAIAKIGAALDFDAAAWIGREVGGFRVQRLLGKGGMGAVFLAERQMRDFQQLVALKLLRASRLDAAALAHFAAERRILARLHHPNIATLIDAGSAEGMPFLVMEYIEGVPLCDYCDNARLTLPERLRLLRELLGALAYAHRALIVHRDLKPGNVLVTADGTLKLLDFGIARLLDTESAARTTATRAFTPDYASPEQLAGEPVGTGSDLYSLGLTLYEVCVGVLPWDSGKRAQTTGAEALPPSLRFRQLDAAQRADFAARRGVDAQQLTRALRGDLGRILARCLDSDPALRYATVEALDADLAALLADLPPPGVQVPRRERALRFARRNAWPLVAAALIALAGAALFAQALNAAQRLAEERDRALSAAQQARTEAAKSQQVAAFVQAMLSGIDPDRARGMDRNLLHSILDAAAERAGRELADQPAVHSAIERTIAASYSGIGEYAAALQHYDAALAAAHDGGSAAAERAGILARKARTLGNLGRLDEAVTVAREAMDMSAAQPADSRERLFAEMSLAGLECDVGKLDDCRERYTRVLERQRRAFGEDDADAQESMAGLAYAESSLGHYAQAQKLYVELIARYRTRYGDADSHVFRTTNSLAVTYLQEKRYADAEGILKPQLEKEERLLGKDNPKLIATLSNLGGAIRQQPGRNAEARPYYERVATVAQAQFGADSDRTVVAEINLAELLRDAGDYAGAEQHARTAAEHAAKAFGADSPYRGQVMDTFATVLIAAHKFADAEQALDTAYALLGNAKDFGPKHPLTQNVIGHYVDLYTRWQRPQLAAQWQARKSS